MATIKGVWVFNDTVKTHFEWLNEYQIENVFFYSNGERFTDMYWYDIEADGDMVYHISYDETLAVAGYYGDISNWENEAFKTVEFDGEQEVSAEFLAWMQENATQQASGGTATPTAEGVKEKLQSLLTASNAKTGKSDANLTDAVKTLLEGYKQGEDSPLPIEISTADEMTALLSTAEVGAIYKYTGETTDTYENGALYVVEESE